MLLQKKIENVANSKTCVFFITSNQENIMKPTVKNWQERKSVLLI